MGSVRTRTAERRLLHELMLTISYGLFPIEHQSSSQMDLHLVIQELVERQLYAIRLDWVTSLLSLTNHCLLEAQAITESSLHWSWPLSSVSPYSPWLSIGHFKCYSFWSSQITSGCHRWHKERSAGLEISLLQLYFIGLQDMWTQMETSLLTRQLRRLR